MFLTIYLKTFITKAVKDIKKLSTNKNMLTLTIIQTTIFVVYVIFLIYRFGILPSISESWYRLRPLNLGYLFTLFCWGIGFLMLFHNTGISPFFFISGAGIIFTGAATSFKTLHSMERIVHEAGATTCVAAALFGLCFDYGMWQPLAIFIPIYLVFKIVKFKNYTWWLEILAFVAILTGMLVHIIK